MSRHILIGDIHGCYEELLALLADCAVTDDDIVVSVGDLVDRGPDSPSVLRWFRERVERGRAIVLMGNHERKHVRQTFSYSQEITRLQFGADYTAAVEWMSHLPYYHETPDYIAVHAAVLPGVPLAEQREEVLSGTISGERDLQAALGERWWHEVYAGDKPIVFGHHVVGNDPLVAQGRVYGLDTGACHGGRLTALVVPGFHVHSVPARADYWESEKRKWQAPVLLGKPWMDMGFAKATRELGRYADEGGETIESLLAWIGSFESVIAACLPRLHEEVARIEGEHGKEGFTAAAESHPLKALIHLTRRGRLDLDAVKQRCATPRKAIEVAGVLGVEVKVQPPAGVG